MKNADAAGCTSRTLFAMTIVVLVCALEGTDQAQPRAIAGCLPLRPADAAPFDPPRFEDYAVDAVFSGPPAALDSSSNPRVRRFRSMLHRGTQQGPNFAGHFTIAGWSCGASCLEFAIVDAANGRVFFPDPIRNVTTITVGSDAGEDIKFTALRFRLESTLLVILGVVNERPSSEGIHYYKWDGTKLTPIRAIPSRKQWCKS